MPIVPNPKFGRNFNSTTPTRKLRDLETFSTEEPPGRAPDFEYANFEYIVEGNIIPTCFLKVMTNYSEISDRANIAHQIQPLYDNKKEDACLNWTLFALGIIDKWTFKHMVDTKGLITRSNITNPLEGRPQIADTIEYLEEPILYKKYTLIDNESKMIKMIDLVLAVQNDTDENFAVPLGIIYRTDGEHSILLIKSGQLISLYDPSEASEKNEDRIEWRNVDNNTNTFLTDRESLEESLNKYCRDFNLYIYFDIPTCLNRDLNANVKHRGIKIYRNNFVEHGGKKRTRRKRMKNKTRRNKRTRNMIP